jgi:hypothetical protein
MVLGNIKWSKWDWPRSCSKDYRKLRDLAHRFLPMTQLSCGYAKTKWFLTLQPGLGIKQTFKVLDQFNLNLTFYFTT